MKHLLLFSILITAYISSDAQGGVWTWVKGADTVNSAGNIGINGTTNSTNYPEGRYQAAQWTDLNGNFWIFGGLDNHSLMRNDLWKYDPVANTWTWVNGPLSSTGSGVYGTQGLSSPTNIPGARAWGIATWTDHLGRLWMHGGYGWDQNHAVGSLDDLWMYDIAINQWAWMKGYATINTSPVYGPSGTTPGPRDECNTAWVNSDGTLWTFGGWAQNFPGCYNDMWKFDINTNNWFWISGNPGINGSRNYGLLNVEAVSNLPPARQTYSHWQDEKGNFYIFGGMGRSSTAFPVLNDVWRYNTGNNLWTWIGGDTIGNRQGIYVNQCAPGASKRPGSRYENRTSYLNGCPDIFWTFGGVDSTANCFNDLWNFNTQTNQWTWVSGDSTVNSVGSYGNIGQSSYSNSPPARSGECLWSDHSGRLWMWGGIGGAANSLAVIYSDMWRFIPDTSCLRISSLLKPLSVQLSDSNICIGDSAHLTVTEGYFISITPFSASISTDSSHATLYPVTRTNYSVIVANRCGIFDTLPYTIVPSHTINVSLATIICPHDSFLYHGHALYEEGLYQDTIIGINCDSIITLTITLLPPVISRINKTFCPDSSIIFHGQTISSPGVYKDTLITVSGCDSIIILTMSIFSPDTIDISKTICFGDSISFDGNEIAQTGIYTNVLTRISSCDNIIRLTLNTVPKPIAGFSISPIDDSLALGTAISLASTSLNSDTILWQLNNKVVTIINDHLPVSDTGIYCIRLIASSNAGCSDTSQYCIYVFENAFAMPNAFTPNSDGKNDLFYPVFIDKNGITVTSFKIYNRWAQLVYNDPSRGWDGNYNGEPQPGETYIYFISISLPDSSRPGQIREIKKEGAFTLLR